MGADRYVDIGNRFKNRQYRSKTSNEFPGDKKGALQLFLTNAASGVVASA